MNKQTEIIDYNEQIQICKLWEPLWQTEQTSAFLSYTEWHSQYIYAVWNPKIGVAQKTGLSSYKQEDKTRELFKASKYMKVPE